MDVLKLTWMFLIVLVLLSVGTCISVEYSVRTDIDKMNHTPAILELNDQAKTKTNQNTSVKRRKRGQRGGIRVKCRRRGQRGYLPPIVTGNVRSLHNKIEELTGCCEHLYQFRECSLMCFTETWLNDTIPDYSVKQDKFNIYRADRTNCSGKSKGGGLALYVNKEYCNGNNVTVRNRVCNPDIELMCVTLRPYYLPREFTQVCIIIVYIPPTANTNTATDAILDTVHEIEFKNPDSVCIITGDFNNLSIDKSLPRYTQYVTCPTRQSRTLDKCYVNIKEAYTSTSLFPLGESDHTLIHLLPRYKPVLKRTKPELKTIKQWSEEALETLRGCLEDTNWDIFIENCPDIDDLTSTVNAYILFCEESIIPKKTVKIYGNNKPWMTKNIKESIMLKKKTYRTNPSEFQKAKLSLKNLVSEGKRRYKEKIENLFKENNTKACWSGFKKITGCATKREPLYVEDDNKFVNDLNDFYGRFDCHDFKNIHNDMTASFKNSVNEDYCSLFMTEKDVKFIFKQVNVAKAPGPDKLSGAIVKHCAEQISAIFYFIFVKSWESHIVPTIWKTSTIIPVPKKSKIDSNNDLRPVALTSIVMKCFEKLVLRQILREVQADLDPHQFAYKQARNTNDAILLLLERLYHHIDTPKHYARVLFIDFSSAFNTIQPHIMIEKLANLHVSLNIQAWVLNFLIKRPQVVKVSTSTSSTRVISTGAPQGCVLSPVLYTIYTNDFRSLHDSVSVIKFADDTAIVGLIYTDENLYRKTIADFQKWCGSNFLTLNVQKTKEMIVDFRKGQHQLADLHIDSQQIEQVQQYKYLGVTVNNKLTWSDHCQGLYKKINQRLFCLRRLRHFNIESKIMNLFYVATIGSIITYAITCWYGNSTTLIRHRIDRQIKKASRTIRSELPFLEDLFNKSCIYMVNKILQDRTHPLYHSYTRSTRSDRLLSIRTRTERYRSSFVPLSVRTFNCWLARTTKNKR